MLTARSRLTHAWPTSPHSTVDVTCKAGGTASGSGSRQASGRHSRRSPRSSGAPAATSVPWSSGTWAA